MKYFVLATLAVTLMWGCAEDSKKKDRNTPPAVTDNQKPPTGETPVPAEANPPVVAQETSDDARLAPMPEPVGKNVIFNDGFWEAQTVEKHTLTGKPACMAQTQSFETDTVSRFEVYAEYDLDTQTFLEPTVIIYGKFPRKIIFANVLTTEPRGEYGVAPNGDHRFFFRRVQLPAAPADVQAAIVPFEYRQWFIDSMSEVDKVTLAFSDGEESVQTLQFRMTGLKNVRQAMFEKCNVKFRDLPKPADSESSEADAAAPNS